MYLPIWIILTAIILLIAFGYLLCAILATNREAELIEKVIYQENLIASLRESNEQKNKRIKQLKDIIESIEQTFKGE